MNTRALILGGCAAVAFGIAPAAAGPCTTEVENLTKTLAASDAGSGPTSGSGASMGQHPPTTTMSRQDSSSAASAAAGQSAQQQHPPTAAMTRETQGTAPAAGTAGQHPPTAAMGAATGGSAASPQDVQRQTAGQPTAAQSQGAATGSDKSAASAALDRARTLDQQGKEAECMDAVRQAKQHAG